MDTFQALSDPSRRRIIELLSQFGRLSATDIHKRFDATPPAISQHLKILREAKLIDMEKQAQKRLYTINSNAMQEIEDWVEKTKKHWAARFDRLGSVLEKEKQKQEKTRLH